MMELHWQLKKISGTSRKTNAQHEVLQYWGMT